VLHELGHFAAHAAFGYEVNRRGGSARSGLVGPARTEMSHANDRTLEILPVTAERWSDLAALFGPRGACGGCWCMHWRLTSREYEAGKGAVNRRALQETVAAGPAPGLLAYDAGQPTGWCAVGPRATFARLVRSRILAPVDDRPVWSVVCFYVDRDHRGRGVTVALLEAATRYAAAQGARIVEGYPVEPRNENVPPVFAFTGLASAFRRAGFREVARRSPTRPIMRREVG
jgi:GNAT superfamily N-acetyltransferase